MPTLMELRRRFSDEHDFRSTLAGSDEVLVADDRGRLTPAQVVEQKLRSLLGKGTRLGTAIPLGIFRRKAK
jgi:hypothetical protein